jgi:hypothetical protein
MTPQAPWPLVSPACRLVNVVSTTQAAYPGQVIANTYREDLTKAGLGSGHHGFEVPCPPGRITLHRAADGAKLQPARLAA